MITADKSDECICIPKGINLKTGRRAPDDRKKAVSSNLWIVTLAAQVVTREEEENEEKMEEKNFKSSRYFSVHGHAGMRSGSMRQQ